MKPREISRAGHQKFLLLGRRSSREEVVADKRPKNELSGALAEDVARFIAGGGAIQEIAPVQSSPGAPPCRIDILPMWI